MKVPALSSISNFTKPLWNKSGKKLAPLLLASSMLLPSGTIKAEQPKEDVYSPVKVAMVTEPEVMFDANGHEPLAFLLVWLTVLGLTAAIISNKNNNNSNK